MSLYTCIAWGGGYYGGSRSEKYWVEAEFYNGKGYLLRKFYYLARKNEEKREVSEFFEKVMNIG